MLVCAVCHKGVRKIAYSRHKKGSSGASEWPLRAQIHKRIQRPNLHTYMGMKFCTKCLRMAKASNLKKKAVSKTVTAVTPAA
ncbi:MAG: hypothetical protein Q7S44_02650 [bacterium]|nr:hypothetical protein [bacterium]